MTSLPTIAPSTGTGASAVTVASMSTLATTGVAVSVPPTQSSSHTGVIIGVVVGVVCVAILVVVLVVLVLRRKARTGRYVGYRVCSTIFAFMSSCHCFAYLACWLGHGTLGILGLVTDTL